MYAYRPYLLFVAATCIVLNAVSTTLFAQTERTKGAEEKIKAMASPAASEEVIEILTLDIKPGRRDQFHNVYVTQSVPLLKKWNFNLVAYGPSLHDANSYYVIRRFKSLEDREKSEDAFYHSDDWKQGPRDAIFALVDHFAYAIVSENTWKELAAAFSMREAAISDRGRAGEITADQFRRLMQTIADAWNEGDARKAADCFTEDARYTEPPDKQVYVGRKALYEFFGGDKKPEPPMKMSWHHLALDEASQIGFGEYTFQMNNRYHGIVIVRIRSGKISNWREYQYKSDLEWKEFVEKDDF
jgi:ketosteroid isomerase-like protein